MAGKKAVGELAIIVGADVTALKIGMDKGARHLGDFQKKASAMGAKMVRIGAMAATAMVAAGAAVLTMGKNAGATVREISNLSRVAGTNTTTFQRWADASKTVGIEQDKLADILKDVHDKVGDFLSTGGGPMADFFENIAPAVGVTADQFARLSGPEALQLYVTSLEKANLPQAKMTFYMEAIASDATALLPLLRNNGSEFKRLGDEAQRAGRILDKDMIANGVKLDKKLSDLTDTMKRSFTKAVLENEVAITKLADFISGTLIPAMGDIITWAVKVAEKLAPIVRMIGDIVGFETGGPEAKGRPENYLPYEPTLTGTNLPSDDEFFNPYIDPSTEPKDLSTPSTKKKAGGGKGLSSDDLKDLQDSLATELELLESAYQEQLSKLEDFRKTKLGTEEEYNEAERRIKEKHENDLAKIEKTRRTVALQGLQSMFGDLAGLMNSENTKLFNIGKAAATAEAVVSGYKSAVSAWEKGMTIGGPGLAVAFTAASLAKTGALISSIQSTSASGGGGQSNPGGGFVPTTVGSSASTGNATSTSVVLQINGQMFGRDQMIELINQINDAQDDGAIIRLA